MSEPYFYPLEDEYLYCESGRRPDGGYNIVYRATWEVWDENTTYSSSLFSDEPAPFCWRKYILDERMTQIADLFQSTQTLEDRKKLVRNAPKGERTFFSEVEKEIESSLDWHKSKLTNTSSFLWFEGYGSRVNKLSKKIIANYPNLKQEVTDFIEKFNKDSVTTCRLLLLNIYKSTDLLALTPDSCFTWAREKLILIDVEMPDIGIETFFSPTKCYLTAMENGWC